MVKLQASETSNSELAPRSIKDVITIVDILAQAATEKSKDTRKYTLKECCYYAGEVNAFLVVKRLLDNLEVDV